MRRYLVAGAVLLAVVGMVGYAARTRQEDGHSHTHSYTDPPLPYEESQSTFIAQDKPKTAAEMMEGMSGVVTVTMTDRGFEPAQVHAKLGDEVRIYLKNKGQKEHNLVIPQFKVFTSNVSPGDDNYIEFTANIKGEWPFFSDAPHGVGKAEPGFTGTLKVE